MARVVVNRPAGEDGGAVAPRLRDGSRVAVIGGGPAGSFFSYFLLDLAHRVDLAIEVDLYEPRDFSLPAPRGCNMCGGIISESLVQALATEGINLPQAIVQRGIDSYVLHMDVGCVRIDTPLHEMRIAAVYRGLGPRDVGDTAWSSFDDYLLLLAEKKGTRIHRVKVNEVAWSEGLPEVRGDDGQSRRYDLVAVAAGVNSYSTKLLEHLPVKYASPRTTKTFIQEYRLGGDVIRRVIGTSMHVFLLSIPRLEFAAIIPKGDYATLVMLGDGIDRDLVQAFLDAPEVRACFPADWDPAAASCQCWPKINTLEAPQPFADRLVLLGDCAVTRLYKDGIGGAYRAAKAAATTAVYHGVSAECFEKHYQPYCRAVAKDNSLGKLIFRGTGIAKRLRFVRTLIWRTTAREQTKEGRSRRLSQILWDLFTGSAHYRDILGRALHPALAAGLIGSVFARDPREPERQDREDEQMDSGTLGKRYSNGETIVRQGDLGDSMYVIQSGQVEILVTNDGGEVRLRTLGENDFFGEMALFDREVRSATVRAIGDVRVLTIDRHGLLRRVQEDPSLALRIIQQMSGRIRNLSAEVARLKDGLETRDERVR